MEFEVKITGYDHQGRGLGRVDNKIIFIPNTMIDEVVKVRITKNKKNYYEGIVLDYIKKNSNRKENICKYYPSCGGCNILHLPYEEQLKYKQDKVINILNKYVDSNLNIKPIIPSDKQFNYRNKVTLQSDGKELGYYNKNSNNLIKIEHCLLLNDNLNEYIKTIENKNDKIILRCNENKVLDNDAYIIKEIGKYKYKVSLDSFFQVNDNVTYKMYEKIKEYANSNKEDNILDLYCGTGTIGIYVSENANKVLGIEINKNAIKDAKENKKLNNIDNITFISDDVSHIINKIDFKPSIIIVDPPRAGLDEKTIKTIIKMKPKRIIYTSCDPMTLARDLNYFKYYYNIDEITPFDMFPNTYHVECVCVLNKR